MKLRAVIVDDEPIARQILREELDVLGGVEVVGEAENGALALDVITRLKPDLIFLDLQMPLLGGFDVVRELKSGKHVPVVVIVTAYDQYAIEAFEAGAVDYLLKPVSQDRVAKAVERAARLASNSPGAVERLSRIEQAAGPETSRSRRIVGRNGDEYVLLSTDEVMAFQAEGDLVWIITARKKYLATQTLRSLSERLQSAGFRRIHRNALVNTDHVRKMSPLSSQRWLVTLNNNLEFIVSKRQAGSIRDLLSW